MNIAKIGFQIILGLIFLCTGGVKLLTSKEDLPAKGITGFENIQPQWIKCLALAEIIGTLTLLVFSIHTLPHMFLKNYHY
ncbi:MAG: hypothetical protein KF763_13390 [Cyclobacteriaceae bacterium]|nr:hypothetical protein [Cyclobacteriaceae bacterium]